MNQERPMGNQPPHFFHPTPKGCVARDLRFARALEELYAEELAAVCAASYRSMLCDGCDARLSEILLEQMEDEILHFRLLGELILELGGNPSLRTQIRVETLHRPEDTKGGCEALSETVLRQAMRDKRHSIDRCQTMLGRTQDRVVRSLLLWLIGEEQRHAERLRSVADQHDIHC